MYIEQAQTPENSFWKYIIGFLCIIAAAFIGQMPLVIAIAAATVLDGKSFPTDNDEVLGFFDSSLTLFYVTLSFAVALLAVYVVVRFLHRQPFRIVTTARKKVDWKRIRFSFLVWTGFMVISILADYYMSPGDYVWNFKLIPFLVLAVVAIVMIPLQTSAEEYIFRGYLMQAFGLAWENKWAPLLMTSVIFGMLHIFNPEVEKMGYIIMVYYIGTGLFLGIITLMDDGLELALGFHAANNVISALLVTAEWTAFRTDSVLKDVSEPTAGYDILVPVLVIFPLLLYIFSRKYNWNNWKEKLTGKLQTYGNDNVPAQADGEPYI